MLGPDTHPGPDEGQQLWFRPHGERSERLHLAEEPGHRDVLGSLHDGVARGDVLDAGNACGHREAEHREGDHQTQAQAAERPCASTVGGDPRIDGTAGHGPPKR